MDEVSDLVDSSDVMSQHLFLTYRWTRGSLKAIWSSFTPNALDSNGTRSPRWARRAALPPSSLRTQLALFSNLEPARPSEHNEICVAWTQTLLKAA